MIEVLVKPGDTREGRAVLITRRERQGVDGDPVAARRRGQGAQGQGRRQGIEGHADRSCSKAAARRPPRQRAAAAQRRRGAVAAPAPQPRRPRRQRTLPTAALPAHEPTAPQRHLPHASPSVRKFARELGVPLDEVKGSGPKGRITQEDVQAFVKGGDGRRRAAPRRGGQGAGAAAAAALGPAAVAEGRLRQVRPGRAQGPVAHQEDPRRQPASQLGDDPARHATTTTPTSPSSRRSASQLNKENEKAGIKVTMLAS